MASSRHSSNGALQFHDGTEKKLLSFLHGCFPVKTGVAVEPELLLSKIDEFCLETHWMMHIGNAKSAILHTSLLTALKSQPVGKSFVVMEVGTYCAYSSILLASLLRKCDAKLDFHVYTFDVDEEFHAVAKEIIGMSGLSHLITPILCSSLFDFDVNEAAMDILTTRLPVQQRQIDFLFIDHDKRRYLRDLQYILHKKFLRFDAVVVADNVVMAEIKDYWWFVRDRRDLFASEMHMSFIEYSDAERSLHGDDDMRDGVAVSIYTGHSYSLHDATWNKPSIAIAAELDAGAGDGWDCFEEEDEAVSSLIPSCDHGDMASKIPWLTAKSDDMSFRATRHEALAFLPSEATAASPAVAAAVTSMSEDVAWDCFGDDEETGAVSFESLIEPAGATPIAEESCLTPQHITSIVIELIKHYPPRLRAHGLSDLLLPPACLVTMPSPAQLAVVTAVESIANRLFSSGWSVCKLPNDIIDKEVADPVDVCIDLVSDPVDTVIASGHDTSWLLPGGLLVLRLPRGWSGVVQLPSEKWASIHIAKVKVGGMLSFEGVTHLRSVAACSSYDSIIIARRQATEVNPIAHRHGVIYPSKEELEHERNLVDLVTITRSHAERRHGVLSVTSHERAVKLMRDHGVVILRKLYSPEAVMRWGEASLHDFETMRNELVTKHDIDLFNPGEKPAFKNFYEFAMREAFRCDIRHTPSIVKLRTEPVVLESERCSGGVNPRHPVIVSILQDVTQPDGGKLNLGNYGKWNFEKDGPGSRERLTNGEIGSIISWPGCIDQKIHADIPHLFNTIDTPPHLLHAFMPAISKSGRADSSLDVTARPGMTGATGRVEERFKVGQTAFVIGSHKLAACAAMMSDDGSGVEMTVANTIRPHVEAGDVIIFDCRILHFGLANNSAPEGSMEGVRRPVMYVNWALPWFEDKKNWESDKLFPSF